MTPDTVRALQDEAMRLGYRFSHTRHVIAGMEYVLLIRPNNTVALVIEAPMEPLA